MDSQKEPLNIGNAQILTLILSEQQSHKCLRLIKEQGLRGGMIIIGRGTVNSTVLNILGIKSQRKDIIHLLLNKEKAEEMMDFFAEALQLCKPGHGIAYTTPVLGVAGLSGQAANFGQNAEKIAQELEDKNMFKKLTVIVDRGMASDVMEIARKAGVRGGTILHGRGAGAEIATSLFGMEIEPEKELVIILMPDELVEKVVRALSQELRLDEPGKGILFVEPVLDTRGLFEMSNVE